MMRVWLRTIHLIDVAWVEPSGPPMVESIAIRSEAMNGQETPMFRKTVFAMTALGIVCWAGATPQTSFAGGKKGPHHPHMHHALHELKEARVELKEAAHDFGGHREKAL